MTATSKHRWKHKRTDETRKVEDLLRQAGFHQVDAYRYNSASIRLRVIDPRFSGKTVEERDAMVEPHLAQLPERTQADIMNLLTFAPEEIVAGNASRNSFLNVEFEVPSESML